MEEIERAIADVDWNELRPVLDDVVNHLDERDRDVILLRFFDGCGFAEIGAQLRMTENAARMRVERALEKMRSRLARRGVTSTAAALGLALTNHAAVLPAVPVGLAANATAAALAGSAVVMTGGPSTLIAIMSTSKLGVTVAAAISIAAIGSGLEYALYRESRVALEWAERGESAWRTLLARQKNLLSPSSTGAVTGASNGRPALPSYDRAPGYSLVRPNPLVQGNEVLKAKPALREGIAAFYRSRVESEYAEVFPLLKLSAEEKERLITILARDMKRMIGGYLFSIEENGALGGSGSLRTQLKGASR